MIKIKIVCDHCGCEMQSDKNTITIKWDDKFFSNSTSFCFCDKCMRELEEFLHYEIRR